MFNTLKKQDKQAIHNLSTNKFTKKRFKRQPKLDRQKTLAEIQHSDAIGFLWLYFFTISFLIIAIVLYRFYTANFFKQYALEWKTTKDETISQGWHHFVAFFQIHKSLGATFDIVFMVLSAICICVIVTKCLVWFLKCLRNIFRFGTNWLFWFILAIFAWIPVINFFVLLLALRKYKFYSQRAIANQTQLSTENTISTLNNQNA